ncbi:conserved hypothetical protein [Burkholderiales bacterium 8X]|nr:conserved hypothetical protein [Burkholderiales bacterium 8X]
MAGRGGRGHQDRGLGLDQPETQVPGTGAGPCRQAEGGRDAQRAGHRTHHHHQPQAHGRRLLHLRQQDRREGDRHCLQRQERCARPAAVRGRAQGGRRGRADRERHRRRRARQPRRQFGLRHSPGRDLVRRRRPRPHGRAGREEELPAGRSRQVPGAKPVPLLDRAGLGGTRRRARVSGGAAQRTGSDLEPAGQARVGAERLCQRAGIARPLARGAVVQLLHLGLQGAARVVERLLGGRQGVRRADRAGRPEQAGVPARAGRDPGRDPGPPARRQGIDRQAGLCGALQGAGADFRHAAGRQTGGKCRSRAGSRRPGPARTDAEQQLEAARRHAAAPQLGREHLHGADGDRRAPSLRPQGGACGRWRRQGADPRAARHPVALEPARSARCQRQGERRGAAQRCAHHLPHRRGGRCGDRPLRHRAGEHPVHARPADHRRPAAAGARRRPLPSPAHTAQHHAKADEGRGVASRHGDHDGAANDRYPGAGSARGVLGGGGTGAARADPGRSDPVGDRGARYARHGARCAQAAPAPGARGAAHRAASHAGPAGRPLHARRRATGRRPRRPRRTQVVAATAAGGRPDRRAGLVRQLPVHLSRAEDQQVDRTARRQGLAGGDRAAARLPGCGRPRQLLPAARWRRQSRQRHPDLVHPRRNARSRRARLRLRAARRGPRTDGARAAGLRRRPHRAQVLEPAEGSRCPQAGGAGGAFALRQGRGPHDHQHHRRAQPMADQRADRLARHPEAGTRRSAPGRAAGRGGQRSQVPALVPGHQGALQHRTRRPLVVADDQRRRQHGKAAARGDGRCGLEGRHRQAGERLHRPAAQGCLAHHHRQPVGRARAREVLEALREGAGDRRYRGRARRDPGPGRLEPRRAGEGQRSGRCAEPDHFLRRARIAGQPAQQRHVPALADPCRRAGQRHLAGDAGRQRQAVAHAAVDRCGAAEGAFRSGLRHQEDHHAGRAEQARQLQPRRRAAGKPGGQRELRHDLGRDHRSDSGRRHHPGRRARPRFADRHAGRKAQRRRLPGFRGTLVRGLSQLLPVPAQGHREDGIHRAPQQRRRVLVAAEPRRGALCAGDVRGNAQCADQGRTAQVGR